MQASQRASLYFLHDFCANLPGVELGTSWGDRPTYKVRGKGFVRFREARADAIDPVTEEPYDDLIVIVTGGLDEKAALVEDESMPFFTIHHFRSWPAVLVQASRLGEMSQEELAEVLVDAWARFAPKRAVAAYLAERA